MNEIFRNADELSKDSLVDLTEKAYRSVYINKGFYEIVFRQFDKLPLSPENQQKILSATVNNREVKKYPLPLSFRKFFLKILLKQVESSGYEVSGELLIAYSHALSESSTNDSLWFHCYFINDIDVITIQENRNLVIKSTTGLRTWEAAKYLSEWCIENSHLLKNRRILELGSGTGLLGIILCKLIEPSSFIFTDKSLDVLRLISSNLQVNLLSAKASIPLESNEAVYDNDLLPCNDLQTGNLHCSSCEISVCHLDWENFSNQQIVNWSPDILVAADVVYDPSMVPHLVHIVHAFLSNGTQCAYIACTVRNSDTHLGFLKHLESHGLEKEDLLGPEKLKLFYDNTSCFKIYKISLLNASCYSII